MNVPARALQLLSERKPGHSLPQPFYRDPGLYELDVQAIFQRTWLMIGFEAELPEPGDYLAETIDGSPIVLIRQKDGSISGFHNSCRHRGARLCADGRGRNPRIVCPYHQWTYAIDGKLLSAARMGEDFDKSIHGLRPIAVECVAGCIYVCLSGAEDAPDFAPFRAALEPLLVPHNLREAKLAYTSEIVEQANWKLVIENGRECLHCAACHPEIRVSFPVSTADHGDVGSTRHYDSFAVIMEREGLPIGPNNGPWWQIGRFPLNPGHVSFSLDGKPLVTKPLMSVNGGDVGTLRWAIEPHNFCHVTADNAFMFSAYPIGPQETRVVAKWLVHHDAVEGVDYDIDSLTHVWTQTNLQDRDLAENNQRGVNGMGYVPGPYSPEAETYVNDFVDWYCDRLRAYLTTSLASAA